MSKTYICNAKSKRMSKRRQKIYVLRWLKKTIQHSLFQILRDAPVGIPHTDEGWRTIAAIDAKMREAAQKQIDFLCEELWPSEVPLRQINLEITIENIQPLKEET